MIHLQSTQHAIEWLKTNCAGELQSDSRQISSGDGFIAWPGTVHDSRQYIMTALQHGAVACLMDAHAIQQFSDQSWFTSDAVACLANLQAHAGEIASGFSNHPSQRLKVLAVTGTNGKTSTAGWIAEALSKLVQGKAYQCGLVGTLGLGFQGEIHNTGMTTPDPVVLQSFFDLIAKQGATHCAIEASSIGLKEHRLAGTHISVGIFTNFTQDHLDYHADMADYWAAKRSLFAWPGLEHAVVNLDDEKSADLIQLLKNSSTQLWTYTAQPDQAKQFTLASRLEAHSIEARHLAANNIHYTAEGLAFDIQEGSESHSLCTKFVGDFNVSNLLAVIATLRTQGITLADAVATCQKLSSIPGRMNSLSKPNQPLVVIDYSHTPDALEKALITLQKIAQHRQGSLQVIFGCGGDRDRSKRPLMGAIALRLAQHVWVTSDNPRTEDPEQIIEDIVQNLQPSPHLTIQTDRAQAIALCIATAKAQDVILIAGKGHEDYQDVKGVKKPFSDMLHAQTALEYRMQGGQS